MTEECHCNKEIEILNSRISDLEIRYAALGEITADLGERLIEFEKDIQNIIFEKFGEVFEILERIETRIK